MRSDNLKNHVKIHGWGRTTEATNLITRPLEAAGPIYSGYSPRPDHVVEKEPKDPKIQNLLGAIINDSLMEDQTTPSLVHQAPQITPLVHQAPQITPLIHQAPQITPLVHQASQITPLVHQGPQITPLVHQAPQIKPITPSKASATIAL